MRPVLLWSRRQEKNKSCRVCVQYSPPKTLVMPSLFKRRAASLKRLASHLPGAPGVKQGLQSGSLSVNAW